MPLSEHRLSAVSRLSQTSQGASGCQDIFLKKGNTHSRLLLQLCWSVVWYVLQSPFWVSAGMNLGNGVESCNHVCVCPEIPLVPFGSLLLPRPCSWQLLICFLTLFLSQNSVQMISHQRWCSTLACFCIWLLSLTVDFYYSSTVWMHQFSFYFYCCTAFLVWSDHLLIDIWLFTVLCMIVLLGPAMYKPLCEGVFSFPWVHA